MAFIDAPDLISGHVHDPNCARKVFPFCKDGDGLALFQAVGERTACGR
jgi:hypothetical protein